MLTYHEILHRYNIAAAGKHTPSTAVLLRDINYLLTLVDRYQRLVASTRAKQKVKA